MTRSRAAACALAALLVTALIAPVAEAGRTSSTVELKEVEQLGPAFAKYSGTVKSQRGKCRKRRKVTVIHNSNPPFTIGETTTDENGKWSLEGPLPPDGDTITVKVKSNRKCKGDKEVYEIGGPPD